MDMNEIIKLAGSIVDKLTKDEKLMDAFKKDPVAVIEKKLGIDLPNDQLNALINGIKAKLKADDVLDAAGKLLGKDPRKIILLLDHIAGHFGGNKNLLPDAPECLSHQALALAAVVAVGCVKIVDAGIVSAADQGNSPGPIGVSFRIGGETHTAVAQRGDLFGNFSKGTVLHKETSSFFIGGTLREEKTPRRKNQMV